MSANAMVMENKNFRAGGKKSLGERFKKYLADNAEYFEAASLFMNGYASPYLAYKYGEERARRAGRS